MKDEKKGIAMTSTTDTEVRNKAQSEMSRRAFVAAAGVAAAGVAAGASVQGKAQAKEASDAADGGAAESAESATAAQWPGEPVEIPESDITEELSCEVLVCGLGGGGCIAACAGAEKGLDVLAIEKNSVHGTIKDNLCLCGSRAQVEKGLTFDTNRIAKEIVRYASGYANQRLIKTYLDESAAFADWIEDDFADDGVSIISESDIGDGYHDIFELWPVHSNLSYTYSDEVMAELDAIESDDPAAKMMAAPGLADYCLEHAEKNGATLRYSTTLVKLEQDEDGTVTGAIAQSVDDEHYIRITASKGVVLATGGYEADPDLLAYLNPAGALLGGVNMTQPGCVGEGIRAGIWAGGIKDANPTLMTFERAALPVGAEPGYPYQGVTLWIGDQPFLKVNKAGERFCNETSPYDWPLHAVSMEQGHVFCSIWDSDYVESIKAFHTMGCSRIDPSPDLNAGIGFEALDGQLADATEAGCVQQADTIEELAEKLGIDPSTLSATVERYNELAAKGEDEDFGKPAKDLIALDKPPYFGCFFAGHVLCTVDGLQIDKDNQVIRADDQSPIPGLYAIGNCSGSFFSVTYPELLWGLAQARTGVGALHVMTKLAEQ
jgi:fumarate reductase flavoprotein subunit